MAGTLEFYQRIIESMNEGVMALDPKGKITMFNDPAGKVLGLAPEDVLEKTFGQVFMMEMEENDAFCQLIMDAVYASAVGKTDTIEFKRPDGRERVISVSTSYLRSGGDGEEDSGGVVVVINDITDITKSREKEKELNLKLRDAFIETEETNKKLAAALKKVQWIRMVITLLVVVGFSGGGYYLWQKDLLPSSVFTAQPSSASPAENRPPTVPVRVSPLSNSISLSGFVAPLEEVPITAPFDGKIRERFFVYDQRVEKGDKLFSMDTANLEKESRTAKAAVIKAQQSYQDLVNWEKGAEVAGARRNHTRAKNSLDAAKRKVEENRILFEKGIISRSEYEAAQETYTNQKLDFSASTENLEAVLDKASQENIDIAKMELINARAGFEEVRKKLSQTVVYAPVSGIIIEPTAGNSGQKDNGRIEAGSSVSQGAALVSIGNLDGLSIETQVDEIDIGKIGFGMKVKVVGDAFSDIPMTGEVRQISSNAKASGRQGPMFEVGVAIGHLTPEQRERIRLGMSANLEIMVYDNPKALMVPLSAVEIQGGEKWVTKVDKASGETQKVKVTTGMTTMDAVEIRSGLDVGDKVVLGVSRATAAPAAKTESRAIPMD